MSPRAATILLAFLTLPAGALSADPVDTLQWLVADADAVLTGTVTGHYTDLADAQVLTVAVTRWLKSPTPGRPPRVLVALPIGSDPDAETLRARREPHLFLLKRSPSPPAGATASGPGNPYLLPDSDTHLIRLVDPLTPLPSSDFEVLTTSSQVLAAAAAEAEFPAARSGPAYVTPPRFSKLSVLISGGGRPQPLQLAVPDDDRWKLAYVRHVVAKPDLYYTFRFDDHARLRSAAAVEALRFYLDDDHHRVTHAVQWPGSIPLVRHKFFYRRAFAADLLRQLDVPVHVTLTEPDTARTPLAASLFMVLALPALLVPLLARRHTSVLRRVALSLAVASATLALASAAMGIRSVTHYDDVLLGSPTAGEHEFSSCYGRFQYLHVRHRPAPYGPIRAAVRLTRRSAVPDHIGFLTPTFSHDQWGLTREVGLTPPTDFNFPPTAANAHRYQLIRIPWWMLATTFALPPLAWLTVRSVKDARRSRRRAAHLCPACGYDLRATPGRCPECGAVPAPVARPVPPEAATVFGNEDGTRR